MSIAGRLVRLILVFLCSAAALAAGLMPTLLRTGRVDPLDWLLPALAALAATSFILWRRDAQPASGGVALVWAMVAAPPLLVIALVASAPPWGDMLVLAVALAISAALIRTALIARSRQGWLMLAVWAALMIAGRVALASMPGAPVPKSPHIGFMSAIPLASPAPQAPIAPATDAALMRDTGVRAPLWQALDAGLQLTPLDALSLPVLRGLDGVLLAQPRLLAPQELVALDRWVRNGGHVVVLADPLFHWAHPGPQLGSRSRAPLTSLLDPLLSHWGLTLEQAPIDAIIERRVLSGGAMLQLAGVSRFTLAKGAPCTLAEQGLIATCRIGRGEAHLVADADWVDDRLWTLAPDRPRDRRAWTSDAIPTLTHFLRGEKGAIPTAGPWLKDEAGLISALRLAFLLTFLLAAGVISLAIPTPTQVQAPKNRNPTRSTPESEA